MLININMHREDNSKYLLYIEPKAVDKLQEPINDELTEMMEKALTKSKKGKAYKGTHRTECGERSSNCDFLLENGMITNSLAPFYLRWYRYSIPESEMNKVKQLMRFYNEI